MAFGIGLNKKSASLAAFLWAVFLHAGLANGVTLADYWARPVPIHGKDAQKKAGPFPETCGACHTDIFRDWSASLHAGSMGPGLKGQFDAKKDPAQATSCYFCHAPAVEQAEHIEKDGAFGLNPAFDERLKGSGVSCPVCHLRDGVFNGPLKRDMAKGMANSEGHAFNQEAFFEDSGFCRPCHQNDDGYEFNGSLLTNTYAEWEKSPYAKKGVTCQFCHMPERRHLFRGIHDKETTLSALRFDATLRRTGASTVASLKITNTGAGHFFPTYATPLVVVRAYLSDESGATLPASVKERYIGRKLSLGLDKELFDTRLPPMKGTTFDYRLKKDAKAAMVVFEVWVEPDEFYERFFSDRLEKGSPNGNKEELQKALDRARGSRYLLYRKELGLSGGEPIKPSNPLGLGKDPHAPQFGVAFPDERVRGLG